MSNKFFVVKALTGSVSTSDSASIAVTSSYTLIAQSVLNSPSTSSFAISASFAQTTLTANSATSASFATTSSAATSITFTPASASYATSASAATSITFVPATASFATTAYSASYFTGTVDFPNGLIITGSVSASVGFSGSGANIIGVVSSSYAVSSSYTLVAQSVLGSITSASFATTAYTASYFTGTVGFPSGLVVTGSVSASSFSGSGTNITGIISSSYAVTSSWAPAVSPDWAVITNKPVGLVSQSSVNTFSDTTITGSLKISGSIDSTAGILAASASAGWAVTGSLNITGTVGLTSTLVDPANPPQTQLSLYAKKVAGRTVLKTLDPSGFDTIIQPSFAANEIVKLVPGAISPTTAGIFSYGVGIATSGTISLVDRSDNLTQTIGFGANIATTAASGNLVGVQTAQRIFVPGNVNNGANGVYFRGRFSFTDASASYGNAFKFFAGLSSLPIAAAQTSGWTSGSFTSGSYVGFRYSAVPADGQPSNFRFVISRGNIPTSASYVDTTIPFNTGSVYDLSFFLPASQSAVSSAVGWNVAVYAPGSASTTFVNGGIDPTVMPVMSQSMFVGAAFVRLAAASASNFQMQVIYAETAR
jgi:hypothetical protein